MFCETNPEDLILSSNFVQRSDEHMDMLNEVEYLALHLCMCSSLQKLHAAVLLQEDNKLKTPGFLVSQPHRERYVPDTEF